MADARGQYDEFEDLVKQAGHDSIFDWISSHDEVVSEFWDTGSVTVGVAGRCFVISINIKEEK